MFTEAVLTFRSYLPLQLEKGMLFLTDKGIIELDHTPSNKDKFMVEFGAPVQPYIINPGNPNLKNPHVIATPEQIGWIDCTSWDHDLMEVDIDTFNRILNEYEGKLLIDLDEENCDTGYCPYLLDGKVIIAYLDQLYSDEEE